MDIKLVEVENCHTVSSNGFQRISIFNFENTNCNELSMEMVILPKGEESTPHSHVETHTMVFTLSGEVTLYFGDQLQHNLSVTKSACVYIPPGTIHYVVNHNEEPMVAIVARSPYLHKVIEYPKLQSQIGQIKNQ